MITLYEIWLWYLFSYFLCEISFPEFCSRRRLDLDNFSNFIELPLLLFLCSIKNMAICFLRFQTSVSLLIFIWTFSLNIFVVSNLLNFHSTPKSVESLLVKEPWSVHFVGVSKTSTSFSSCSQIGLPIFISLLAILELSCSQKHQIPWYIPFAFLPTCMLI